MRYVGSLVLAGIFCFSLLLILGAARPFDRVPLEDATYSHLVTLSEAGLLEGYTLPEGELSRLEVAALAQRSLAAYGELLVSGGSGTVEAEDSLSFLLESFTDEMSQLGTAPTMPSRPNTSMGDVYELERRIAYLENEQVNDVVTDAVRNSCCPEEDPCPTHRAKVSMFGDMFWQLDAERTNYIDPNQEALMHSNLHLYWGEIGWEVEIDDWYAHFCMLWNDLDDDMNLNEAWAQWNQQESGAYINFGRLIVGFCDNDYYFPTYPAANDLGLQTTRAIGAGIDTDTWGLSAHLVQPQVDIVDEDDTFTDYVVNWNIIKQEADECQDGYSLVAGYASHLGNHDLRIAGDGPLLDRVSAYNVFGRYDWNANRYHLLADYTAAIDEFHVADLDANADGIGDSPSALNIEFVYEPEPDRLWGVNYQATDEMAGYANERIGALFGRRLNEAMMIKLEYTHGTFDAFALNGADTDDRFVAELNLTF